LLERIAGRQRLGAVEDADVVQTEEAAREDITADRILAVDPPREIEQQLLERTRQEMPIAATLGANLVHAPAGPSVYRRVDVREVIVGGGQLAVGVQVPLAQEQQQLLPGKLGIDAPEDQHVEGQVPGEKSRVFPLVGHTKYIATVEVPPVSVTEARAALG